MKPGPATPSPPSRPAPAALYVLFFGLSFGGLAAAAGVVVILSDPSRALGAGVPLGQSATAAAGLLGAVTLGRWLAQGGRRYFAYLAILVCALACSAVALCEVASRLYRPAWPAYGLHGVEPARLERAGFASRESLLSFRLNSWGQLDYERRTLPAEGVRRIVMIGDSFVDDPNTTPLPLAVQRLLAHDGIEVVNLGVSASDVDDYYWRLRQIALRLHPDEVVVVVYAGNDFRSGPTLASFAGLAATYPRRSVLSLLGLSGLNHALSNGRRPFVRAWLSASGLWAAEARLFNEVRRTSDAAMPHLLASLLPEGQRRAAEDELRSLDLSATFALLRSPDAGLFRSYYLRAALRHPRLRPGAPSPPAGTGRARYVLTLVEEMARACDARHVVFSLVIAPEASQVDPRFRRIYDSFSSLSQAEEFTREASRALGAKSRVRGIPVLDLHETLGGVEGTYLDLDGHWSERGLSRVASAVAPFVQECLDRVRPASR